ncbi:MAG: nodulation protein NfeD [Myxococcota bacterium]|nr:nodulation protein NfeD [Myxococcota bacterium]
MRSRAIRGPERSLRRARTRGRERSRRRASLRAWACLAMFVSALGLGFSGAVQGEGVVRDTGPITIVRIDGSINPASSDYLQKAIRDAEAKGSRILLLELDTPGGLVTSTQDIIQAMLRSTVPIVVFVSPQGAWAGSAGTFITMAGHVAVMAPGSTIGAAAPVGVGGGGATPPGEDGKPADTSAQKAENMLTAFIQSIAEERGRNVEWAQKAVRESVAVTADQAVELGVIDFVANDRADLFAKLEGREVKVGGEMQTLALQGAPSETIEMELLTRILDVLASPDLAVLLGMAGLLGLYIEMNNPGLIVPGVVGAICLVLAMIAFQILPFSWTGLLLMGIGVALMVSELFFSAFGLLALAGLGLFLLGGSTIFDRPEVSDLNVSFWPVLVPAAIGMSAFGALVAVAVGRTLGRPQEAGVSELVGMRGVAKTALDPSGTVFVRGEFWNARAEGPVDEDAAVEVIEVDGLLLHVRAV